MCDGRDHPLEVIYTGSGAFDYEPYPEVKWCPDCGGIVIDRMVDGRAVGSIKEMRFPEIAYKYFRGGSSK